jgi:hypothetical protein
METETARQFFVKLWNITFYQNWFVSPTGEDDSLVGHSAVLSPCYSRFKHTDRRIDTKTELFNRRSAQIRTSLNKVSRLSETTSCTI